MKRTGAQSFDLDAEYSPAAAAQAQQRAAERQQSPEARAEAARQKQQREQVLRDALESQRRVDRLAQPITSDDDLAWAAAQLRRSLGAPLTQRQRRRKKAN